MGDRTKTQRQFAHGALYSNHLKAFTKETVSECTTCTLAELVGNHGTQGTARAWDCEADSMIIPKKSKTSTLQY